VALEVKQYFSRQRRTQGPVDPPREKIPAVAAALQWRLFLWATYTTGTVFLIPPFTSRLVTLRLKMTQPS